MKDVSLPVATFPARNAPMGVRFVTHSHWPFLNHLALVALHGSWAVKPAGGSWGDKSTRRPPAIMAVTVDDRSGSKVRPLLSGLQNVAGERLARPMDIEVSSTGDILFTSDGGQLEGLFCLCKTAGGSPQ
jgi:glucose/arabinose dehydrogenase